MLYDKCEWNGFRASEERNGKTWLGNKKEVGRRDQMLRRVQMVSHSN